MYALLESNMRVWIYLIGVLILLITVFILVSKKQEGFLGDFGNTENNFMKNQTKLFWNDERQLTVFDTMSVTSGINNAFRQPDLFKGVTTFPEGTTDYTSLFTKKSLLENDVEQCKTLTSPTQISRDTAQSEGCGWVYSDNNTVTSVGAYGTFENPSFPNEVQKRLPNGEWIWNKDAAIKKEEIKQCRQITTCPGIGGVIQGSLSCGYCNDANNRGGVPIQNGQVKYPTDERGGCTNVISITGNCPTSQQIAGAELSISPDCNSSNWDEVIENGITTTYIKNTTPRRVADIAACSSPNRGLGLMIGNDITAPPATGSPNACDIVNGQLTKACFITKAREHGFQDGGRLIKILDSKFGAITTINNLPFEEDKVAYNLLKGEITNLLFQIFGGSITVDALTLLYTIINSKKTSPNKRIREAVAWFQLGTAFEQCEYENSDSGPFLLQCMQQEFRKAGCQPEGLSYPKTSNQNTYNTSTWQGLKNNFSRMHSQMNSSGSNFKKQDEAVRNCLGTKLFRPRIEVCNEIGLEYLIYKPLSNNTKGTFLGRFISKSGSYQYRTGCLPWDYSLPMGQKYFPVTFPRCIPVGTPNIQVIRTVKTPKNDETINFTFWKLKTENRLQLNNINPTNVNQIEQWGVLHKVRYTVPLTGKVPYTIIYTSNDPGDFPCEQFNIKDYQLRQDSWKPVIGFDFFKGQVADSNDVIKFNLGNNTYQFDEDDLGDDKKRGYISISPNRKSHASAINYISDEVITTITGMLNVSSTNSTNGNSYIVNSDDFKISIQMTSATQYNIKLHMRYNLRENLTDTVNIESSNININQWTHFTIIFGKALIVMLINGYGGQRSEISYTQLDNPGIFAHQLSLFPGNISGSIGGGNVTMKVAWFHIYDYRLNNEEILRDINYDSDNYIMPTAAAPPATPEFGCRGVEYGNILNRTPASNVTTLRVTGGTTLEGCCTACNNDSQCKAFEQIQKYNICSLFSKAEGGTVEKPPNSQGYINDAVYIKP